MKTAQSQKTFLIVSPGIEDGGIRGLGKVTLALIDSLSSLGHSVSLLTGAPVKHHLESTLSGITQRRAINHYLSEGVRSSAFKLTRSRLLVGVCRDMIYLLTRRVSIIPNQTSLPAQHSPDVLRHYNNVDRFVNFYLLYKFTSRIPSRLRSTLIMTIAALSKTDVVITASPFPLKRPFFIPKRIKIVQFVHDVMPLNILETPTDTIDRFVSELRHSMGGADLVITSSHNARKKLGAVIEGLKPIVVYLPNTSFSNDKKLYGPPTSNLGKRVGKKYILFMSTLEKRKNAARLIEAFGLIAGATDSKLVLVGGKGYGREEIEEAFASLDKKAQDSIIFTGYISEREKWALLEGASLVVHPSIDEGLGIPIIEGLVAAVPVLATRLQSIEEFAPDDSVVYIEDPYDVTEIADKLVYCLHNLNTLKQSAIASSSGVNEFFSQENFNNRLQSALAQLND